MQKSGGWRNIRQKYHMCVAYSPTLLQASVQALSGRKPETAPPLVKLYYFCHDCSGKVKHPSAARGANQLGLSAVSGTTEQKAQIHFCHLALMI